MLCFDGVVLIQSPTFKYIPRKNKPSNEIGAGGSHGGRRRWEILPCSRTAAQGIYSRLSEPSEYCLFMCNRILRRPEARAAGTTWLQRGKEGLLDVPLNRSAGGRTGHHGLWEGQGWKTSSFEWLTWVQGTMTGRKYGLEVGLVIRHSLPGGPRVWCRACGPNVRGTDTPGALPPCPPEGQHRPMRTPGQRMS